MNNAIINKIINLQELVKNTIRSNQLYKTMGFLEINDLNSCVIFAENIYTKLKKTLTEINDTTEDILINKVQDIMREISTLISLYGCESLDKLIHICIGNKYVIEDKYVSKYKLLNAYVKPIHYKTIDWKKTKNSKEDSIIKTADNFECFDLDNSNVNFQNRIYGIKVVIHNIEKQHSILVYGVIEDIMLELIDDKTIADKMTDLQENKPAQDEKSYDRFIKCLTLKDLLIYSNDCLKEKYITFIADYVNKIAKKSLLSIINEFIEQELYDKRNTLITLLINSGETECHYLAYLLYDLLSNDIRGMIDTYEQTTIYDSLPCNVKRFFREAMKHIIAYTNKLTKIDINKISLEQRICLMKTDDTVKEKAMVKLKEVKLKSEDTGSKAMQYLDGLLKIPFGIYKKEEILQLMPTILSSFSSLVNSIHIPLLFPIKESYTSVEVYKYVSLLKNAYKLNQVKSFITAMAAMPKNKLTSVLEEIASFINKHPHLKSTIKVDAPEKTLKQLRAQLNTLLDKLIQIEEINEKVMDEIIYKHVGASQGSTSQGSTSQGSTSQDITDIETKLNAVSSFMQTTVKTLDESVYGHTKAKRQIERIIGQWTSGDLTGYCFGFEGPPGVGKTSLAKKGISQCIKDEDGVPRPFAFIAMGGSSNSSTLDGHNYTYVGSTWGRIVDILMDTKIMNPIIFIDELDKVSKTENGKEIIGILTHLIDQTQNDSFQDKYFNGINLNLSKALFIFSYNDADLIDRILLDRIHRIKFDHLTNEDKLVIVRNFILPEVYKKMGLVDVIEISDDTVLYIIDHYTSEPGVRKLKELIFEIVGEINLSILKNDSLIKANISIPIVITIDDIKYKYLKERHEIKLMIIHQEPTIGLINGLWANSLGKGGVLPIEASFFPSGSFLDLKLTGMQGDVMKESMNVAKSVAWSLFNKNNLKKMQSLQKTMEDSKNQGIHIHVPEGATPKDGPSAGAAITMVLYSLFNEQRIKNDVAMTGEICLQGRITAIGGLELKILGGISAGVKTFIYPSENEKDFNDFIEKYSHKKEVKDTRFISATRIEEIIPLIFQY